MTPHTTPTSHPYHHMADYSTPVAVLAALLILAHLVIRLLAVPLALAALLTARAAHRLDRWLGALPRPQPPVRATALRAPLPAVR